MAWAFVEHVTNMLEKERPGDPRQPTLWPSEATGLQVPTPTNGLKKPTLVGKCRRARFFRFLESSTEFYGNEKAENFVQYLKESKAPVERYMRWIWTWGEQAEEVLINFSKNSGVFLHEQISMYIKKYNVSGKMDIDIINPETGKFSIVEVKSVYGYNANFVLGSHWERANGSLGTPRDSNLMQIGLYDWWWASHQDAYEHSRLVYVARDTGRYAEYLIKTEKDEDGNIWIWYRYWAPVAGSWINSGITINSILASYKETSDAVDTLTVPPRDFDLVWDDEKMLAAYEAGLLNKTDSEKYRKWKLREDYNAFLKKVKKLEDDEILESIPKFEEEIANSILTEEDDAAKIKKLKAAKPKTSLKKLEKDDWQCRFCSYKDVCYERSTKQPFDVSINETS